MTPNTFREVKTFIDSYLGSLSPVSKRLSSEHLHRVRSDVVTLFLFILPPPQDLTRLSLGYILSPHFCLFVCLSSVVILYRLGNQPFSSSVHVRIYFHKLGRDVQYPFYVSMSDLSLDLHPVSVNPPSS